MLQTGEVIIIVLLALVVLGPQRLPELARKAGQWASELRKAAREITAGLEAEVSQFKEIGDDLKAPLEDLKAPLEEIGRDVSNATGKGFDWKGPKPLSGPTPEDAMRDLERIQSQGDEDLTDEDSDVGDGEADAGPDDEPAG